MSKETNSYDRYRRQIILKEFGIAGQQKLMDSKVLVVGAGGLGCAALQYLTAAGIGSLGIIDDDVVSLDNLHRQILYSSQDIVFFKAIKAKERLLGLNSDINIIAYCERLTTQNALKIFADYDIIIDGTDNFASRYLINDACVLLNKPLVYGAVSQYEGQVSIFNYQLDDQIKAVNYRDLFPQPPKERPRREVPQQVCAPQHEEVVAPAHADTRKRQPRLPFFMPALRHHSRLMVDLPRRPYPLRLELPESRPRHPARRAAAAARGLAAVLCRLRAARRLRT